MSCASRTLGHAGCHCLGRDAPNRQEDETSPRSRASSPDRRIDLPKPERKSRCSVERALHERRSAREVVSKPPLSLRQIAQLLWAGQGITTSTGLRTSPSAGALFPLELHVVVGCVEDLEPAVYRYLPLEHALVVSQDGDRRAPLSRAVVSRECTRDAAAVIAITAVPARTRVRYGSDARRYVLMEAGHVGQSICLQAVSLGLSTITLGAFHAGDVRKVLGLPSGERAEYLVAVGAVRR